VSGDEIVALAFSAQLGSRGAFRMDLSSREALFESIGSSNSLQSIEKTKSLAVLVGSTAGRLFQRIESEWRDLGPGPSAVKIMGIADYGEGIAMGTELGELTQYYPGVGFCPALPVANTEAEELGAAGKTILFGLNQTAPEGSKQTLFVLEPVGE
jgi:hypothetical protein